MKNYTMVALSRLCLVVGVSIFGTTLVSARSGYASSPSLHAAVSYNQNHPLSSAIVPHAAPRRDLVQHDEAKQSI